MRSEPDINLLGQIHQVDLALHLWQTYHSTVLVTLISTAPQIRKGAVQVNQNSVTRVENKVNMLMHKLLDGKPRSHYQAISHKRS